MTSLPSGLAGQLRAELLFGLAVFSAIGTGCRGRTASPKQCADDLPIAWNPSLAGSGGCDAGNPSSGYSVSRPLGFYDGDPVPAHMAYLTFDDGPTDWTTDFLDILLAKNVHVTFFVNAKNTKPQGLDGYYIDAHGSRAYYRDALRREADEGHVLGNHTVDHADLTELALSDVAAELDDNEFLVNKGLLEAGGVPVLLTLLRPPYSRPWEYPDSLPDDYAVTTARVGSAFATRGLNVFFNLDSTDSDDGAQGESYLRNPPSPPPVGPDAPTWAEKVTRIRQAVLQDPRVLAGEGVIVVFHDTHPTTRDALPDIIDGLRAQGYDFGTMEDYSRWRWGRSSAEVVPGPSLYNACVPDSEWGCQSFGDGGQVCGRMWLGFEAVGGAATLGDPVGPAVRSATTGVVSQSFTHALLELHPELSGACRVEWSER